MAYTVSLRTHEIGVRMALGAEHGDVVRMLVRHSMSFVLAGITAGLGAAAGLTRLMAALLYDMTPNDPATFATVASMMAATALVACWLTAAKAARLDPIVALRHA